MSTEITSHPRGRALLFEHLPDFQFQKSHKGVLLIVFSNGEAFFHPLTDQNLNNCNTPFKVISKETSKNSSFPSSGGTDRYSVFEYSLTLNEDLCKATTFNFPMVNNKTFIPPSKILLSPNKRLLLIIGVLYRGQSCLVVYPSQVFLVKSDFTSFFLKKTNKYYIYPIYSIFFLDFLIIDMRSLNPFQAKKIVSKFYFMIFVVCSSMPVFLQTPRV
jgi:hypothetical protein